ncbi:MAG: hypothetical protein ACYTGG_01685 [Planctomycetota bacterium]
MEFVSNEEGLHELLSSFGIEADERGEDQIGLEMAAADGIVHLHLGCDDCEVSPRDGANVISVDRAELAASLEQIINRLHINELLLIPVGKWRNVFDVVAFSLAENEEWQAIDAAATVELNTRDPLLCGPADLNILRELISTLLTDADSAEQGLMLLSTASPVLAEVIPSGAITISVGSQVLADEVLESVAG